MESSENDEGDDDSRDSLPDEDSDQSDFDFDYEDKMEIDSLNQSYIDGGGFTSISLKDATRIAVFRSFFTQEIVNLITDQTNIYGAQKKRRNAQNKIGR